VDREQTRNHSRMSNPHPESPAKQRFSRLAFVLFLSVANSVTVLVRGKSLVFGHSKSWQFEGFFGEDGVSRHEPAGHEDEDG
jgi:hypothetical protein